LLRDFPERGEGCCLLRPQERWRQREQDEISSVKLSSALLAMLEDRGKKITVQAGLEEVQVAPAKWPRLRRGQVA